PRPAVGRRTGRCPPALALRPFRQALAAAGPDRRAGPRSGWTRVGPPTGAEQSGRGAPWRKGGVRQQLAKTLAGSATGPDTPRHAAPKPSCPPPAPRPPWRGPPPATSAST